MKAFLNWSGGKDSAYCLYQAGKQGLDIGALLTSFHSSTGRVSMHGVRPELIERQATSLSIPLFNMAPEKEGLAAYEQTIHASNEKMKAEGFTHAVFGDLYLEDLRAYRQQLYAKDNIETLFPIWQSDTKKLLQEFIDLGFKAVVICVDAAVLPQSFCGRLIDENFLKDLPASVDPCGERGEYHSFVFDGPNFQTPVHFTKGEQVYREYPAPKRKEDECFTAPLPPAGFWFCDLLPV
jgi:uncharacterized protein (TIGR00290 family)